MQDEDRAVRQVYAITSAAVSRAVAACRPSGPLQSTEKIAVTAKLASQPQHLHVSGPSSVSTLLGYGPGNSMKAAGILTTWCLLQSQTQAERLQMPRRCCLQKLGPQ